MNLHAGLIVRGSTENLALGGGDGSITRYQGRHHRTQCLDTQGERGYIEQKDILDVSLMWLLTEELLHLLLNQRHSGLPTNQNHLINLG